MGQRRPPLDLAALYNHLEAQGHALEIVLKWNAPVAFRVTKGTGLIYIERHDHLWRIFHWFNGPDHNITHLIDPAHPNAIEQVEAEIAKRRP